MQTKACIRLSFPFPHRPAKIEVAVTRTHYTHRQEKKMKLNIAILSCFIFIGAVSVGAAAPVMPYEMDMEKLTNALFGKNNIDRGTFLGFTPRRLSNSTAGAGSSTTSGGSPVCEINQDCFGQVPPHSGLLNHSIVCGNGAPYGVTHKSCFQVCKMQQDGTHTVEMENAPWNANCSDFATRVGWMFPVTCGNFNNSFQENVCLPAVSPEQMGAPPQQSTTHDWSQSNVCEDPSNFDPNAMYDSQTQCDALAAICHSLRPHGGLVPYYANYVASSIKNCCKVSLLYIHIYIPFSIFLFLQPFLTPLMLLVNNNKKQQNTG